MALFKRERRHRRGQKAAPPGTLNTFSPELVEVLRSWDGALASFGTIYRELAPVRTVVDFLADAVSTTALKVYERTPSGRPEDRDSLPARVLRSPNPEMTGVSLVGTTVRDLGVYGVAYWRKIDEGPWLVPLPPERVIPKGGDLLVPEVFQFARYGAAPLEIPRSEIAYFRLYSPHDRRVGVSKLESLRPILAEEIEVSRHRQYFWRYAARREGVIERPADAPDWDPDARERFRNDWAARTATRRNAGKTAILEDGMKWNPDSFSPKESEFVEGRKFILEAVARAYNVPVSLLGLTNTATFASQREFHKALYQDTLPFWYQILESEIQAQVFPWLGEAADGDLYVEFEVESKLRGSFEEQAQIIAAAVGRPWMTVAEVRQLFNLPDRGDPLDDEMAIPTNNVSLGTPAPPPQMAPVEDRPALTVVASENGAASSRTQRLKSELERQQRTVLARVGAGQTFDVDHWNRQLQSTIAGWESEE